MTCGQPRRYSTSTTVCPGWTPEASVIVSESGRDLLPRRQGRRSACASRRASRTTSNRYSSPGLLYAYCRHNSHTVVRQGMWELCALRARGKPPRHQAHTARFLHGFSPWTPTSFNLHPRPQVLPVTAGRQAQQEPASSTDQHPGAARRRRCGTKKGGGGQRASPPGAGGDGPTARAGGNPRGEPRPTAAGFPPPVSPAPPSGSPSRPAQGPATRGITPSGTGRHPGGRGTANGAGRIRGRC